MSDNLKAKGVTAFIWDFAGKLARNGMGFIISIFLARLLEPSEFGLIAMVMVVIGIAAVFSDSGLGVALIQRRRILPIHYSSVFYFNIMVAILLGLVTFFSAGSIAEFYNNEELIPLAQVMSFSFIIGAFSSVQSIRLRKELNYALLTKIGLFSSLISGAVGITLAFSGAGVWSLVAQTLSAGIISNILLWVVSKWRPSLTFSLKALMQLWTFGFHMFLTGLIDAVFSRLDVLIIGKLFTPATLGFYNRAKSLDQMIVAYSAGSLMAVVFPLLSKVQNDLSRFQNIVIKSLGIISFVTFLLIGGVFLVSEELIVFLFSEKWLPSVPYLKVLILSGFGYAIGAILVNVLASRGNSKAYFRIGIYKKIPIAINLYVGFLWGIEGYLYGMIVTTFISQYINIIYAAREISVPALKFIKIIMIQMCVGIIAVLLVIFIMQYLEYGYFTMFMIKGIIYVCLYIIISYLFKSEAYLSFWGEMKPILIKIIKKITRKIRFT